MGFKNTAGGQNNTTGTSIVPQLTGHFPTAAVCLPLLGGIKINAM